MPRDTAVAVPPLRPPAIGAVALDQLWKLLTEEQRHRSLVTLSGIVLRQLGAPRDDQEVHDERS